MSSDAEETTVEPLEIQTYEGSKVRFELAKYGAVRVELSLTLPNDMGHISVPVDVDEEADVDRLYRMARRALQLQLGEAEAELPDPELPTVQEIQDAAVPPFEVLPLCLEHTGRKKIIDVRADGVRRWFDVDSPPSEEASNGGAEWGYLPGVVVHSSECVKVRGHIKEAEAQHRFGGGSTRGHGVAFKNRSALDGRFASWPEILPQIRKGALHVTICQGCKPLGRWSKTVNAQVSFSTADQPPPECPWRFANYNGGNKLNSHQRRWVWRKMNMMTPERWTALANAIEQAAAELAEPTTEEAARA